MKKYKLIIALFIGIVFAISTSSCKKFVTLTVPKSLVSGELIFEDDVTSGAAVNGMYAFLRSSFFASGGLRSVALSAGLSSDEAQNNVPDLFIEHTYIQANQLLAENPIVFDMWASMYQTIYRSNAIIEGVNRSTGMTTGKKIQFEAEARFVRAFCYFYLVNTFGDVPLAISSDYKINDKLPRTSQALVYDLIVDDLKFAKQNLAPEYPFAERIRPNQFTAIALLARVYLYLKDWPNAEIESSLLIDNTEIFGLSTLDQVFGINSSEAIWQLDQDAFGTGTGHPQEVDPFSPDYLSQSFSMRPELWNSFEAGDARKTMWTGETDGLYYPSKYKQNIGPIFQYSMVLRLAEQILIRAEARAHLNKLTGANSAESDINAIRDRAGLPNTIATTEEELLMAIEKERRSELFIEWGHRWYDLKRWGKLTEVLEPIKSNWSANDTIYPIPLQDYKRNPNLRPQNPGYQ